MNENTTIVSVFKLHQKGIVIKIQVERVGTLAITENQIQVIN